MEKKIVEKGTKITQRIDEILKAAEKEKRKRKKIARKKEGACKAKVEE